MLQLCEFPYRYQPDAAALIELKIKTPCDVVLHTQGVLLFTCLFERLGTDAIRGSQGRQ